MLLVGPHGQEIICFLVNDLLGNLFLAAYGIDDHNAAAHIQQAQQARNRRNLVTASATATWPSTTSAAVAQALTIVIIGCSLAVSKE